MSRRRLVKIGVSCALPLVAGMLLLGGPLGPAGTDTEEVHGASPFVELPEGDFELKPGEHVDVVHQSCSLCHSVAPIIQHEGYSKEMWAFEVKKMKESYGAPLDDATAELVIQYLQENYSREAMQER